MFVDYFFFFSNWVYGVHRYYIRTAEHNEPFLNGLGLYLRYQLRGIRLKKKKNFFRGCTVYRDITLKGVS